MPHWRENPPIFISSVYKSFPRFDRPVHERMTNASVSTFRYSRTGYSIRFSLHPSTFRLTLIRMFSAIHDPMQFNGNSKLLLELRTIGELFLVTAA